MTNLPVDNSSQEGLVSGNPGQEVDDDGRKFVQQQVTEELNPAMQRIKAGDQSKEEHAGRLTHHLTRLERLAVVVSLIISRTSHRWVSQ